MNENGIGKEVVDAAVQVHRELGPGLLKTVYEVVLAVELERRELTVERQVPVPILYGSLCFEEGFRADITVEGIVELKSVEQLSKGQTGLHVSKASGNGLPEQNLGVFASLRETKTQSRTRRCSECGSAASLTFAFNPPWRPASAPCTP